MELRIIEFIMYRMEELKGIGNSIELTEVEKCYKVKGPRGQTTNGHWKLHVIVMSLSVYKQT